MYEDGWSLAEAVQAQSFTTPAPGTTATDVLTWQGWTGVKTRVLGASYGAGSKTCNPKQLHLN